MLRFVLLACLASVAALAAAQSTGGEIPAGNRAELTSPPPRPSEASVQAQAALLFEAIVHDDPARAASFFFPRDAFLEVKAMQRADRYYDRLRKRFDQDVHAMHARTPELDKARFERLVLGKRGGWMKPGDEGNKLPYWAARHAFLHYRVGEELRKLEVRVLITWDDRWYVIHLDEFH